MIEHIESLNHITTSAIGVTATTESDATGVGVGCVVVCCVPQLLNVITITRVASAIHTIFFIRLFVLFINYHLHLMGYLFIADGAQTISIYL